MLFVLCSSSQSSTSVSLCKTLTKSVAATQVVRYTLKAMAVSYQTLPATGFVGAVN